MGWHDPHTYRVNELAGVAVDMNQDVSDNLRWLHNPPGCRRRNNVDQTLTNGVYDVSLALNTVDFDAEGDMGDTADVITIARTAVYLVGGSVHFNASDPDGERQATVIASGQGEICRHHLPDAGDGLDTYLRPGPVHALLTAGQVLTLGGFQNSGSDMTSAASGVAAPVLLAQWLGGA